MANSIPPLVSNTPPPLDFDDNNDNDDDFGGLDTSDVTFNNNNFLDDTSSLPSTPRDLSKTPDSISGIDRPCTTLPENIVGRIVPNELLNKIDENSTNLDSKKIILNSTKCDKSLESNNDNNYYNPEVVDLCDNFEVGNISVISKDPCYFIFKEEDDSDNIFNDFKLNEDSPSLLSNHDPDYANEKFDSNNNNNSSSKEIEISKNFAAHISNISDDGSVLSLKFDPVQLSSDNSPISTSAKLKQDDLERKEYQILKEIDKAENDNHFINLNKLETFEERFPQLPISNIYESSFETHFEANFKDSEFIRPTNEVNEQFISLKISKQLSHLNDINEDDFDDFQDFRIPSVTSKQNIISLNSDTQNHKRLEDEIQNMEKEIISTNNINDGVDDDFGDFAQSKPSEIMLYQKPRLERPRLMSILKYMFPILEQFDENIQFDITEYNKIEKNTSLVNLLDFDTTIALSYQWSNSNSYQMLVKSLGIDSRNILFGSKWNIPVPRFAANLGFSPLEPLKSTTSNMNDVNINAASINFQNVSGTDVPAAQFDWNSAGLINPLDGQKDTNHDTTLSENHPTRTEVNSITNYPSSVPTTTTSISTILSSSIINPPKITSTISSAEDSSVKTDLEIQLEHTNDFEGIINPYVSSSTSNLRETHIFTPSKCVNPISRDVSGLTITNLDKINIDTTLEDLQVSSEIKINKNVITKEYRDVEYQFPGSNDILQPVKMNINTINNSNANIIINWPDPGDLSATISLESGVNSERNSEELEFSDFHGTNTIKYDPQDDDVEFDEELNKHGFGNKNDTNTNCPVLSSPVYTSNVANKDGFLKPSIGSSPTEELNQRHNINDFDDEFTEFQYVSPSQLNISSFTNTPNSMPNIDSMSPKSNNKFVPNYTNFYESSSMNPIIALGNLHDPKPTSNQQQIQSISSVWADPSGIDSDEIARIEAAFSYNKTKLNNSQPLSSVTIIEGENKAAIQNHNKDVDDDEWSDFVSSTTIVTSMIKMNKFINSVTTSTANIDDDWSDFVSGTPALPIISIKSQSHSTHKDNSQPNFSSWNSPIQYNSYSQSTSTPWVSNLSQSTQGIQNFLKKNNNSLLDIGKSHNQQHNTSMQNNTKLQQHPNISLIPDLGFIAPKNLINVPRTNFNTKK